MAMTLEKAEQALDAWIAASVAVAGGQEARVGDRVLRRADAQYVNAQIDYWERRVAALSETGRKGPDVALARFRDE
jgi:hypothetical protein